MIRRERSALRITCDGCGQFRQDTSYRSNKLAWDEAKAAGWTAAAKNGGKDWDHYCAECSKRKADRA